MGVFSGAFYGNFAFFREQACTTVCPYGRLQGVLLDRKSIVIAYDHVRGEPRGLFRKGEDRAAGRQGRLYPMQCLCPRVPHRDRYSQRYPIGMRELHGLHRCVRSHDDQRRSAHWLDPLCQRRRDRGQEALPFQYPVEGIHGRARCA